MTETDLITSLKRVELFRDLSSDDLQKILKIGFVSDYPVGYRLFTEGLEGNMMYVLLDGEVGLFKKGKNDEEIPLTTLTSGSFIGEMSLIESHPRSATAIVKKPLKTLVISKKAFQQILEIDPRITSLVLMRLLKVLSSRLRKALSGN